jgi:hypothetical protein
LPSDSAPIVEIEVEAEVGLYAVGAVTAVEVAGELDKSPNAAAGSDHGVESCTTFGVGAIAQQSFMEVGIGKDDLFQTNRNKRL